MTQPTEPTHITRAQRQHTDNTNLNNSLNALGNTRQPTPEWHIVLALVRGGWPGNMTDAETLAWPQLLADLNPQHVANAVRELHQTGQRFRPRPSEIREHLAKQKPAGYEKRKRAWQTNLLAFAQRHGRQRALEFFDPDNKFSSHYPTELDNIKPKLAQQAKRDHHTP